MNPKPFPALNHFTVPVSFIVDFPFLAIDGPAGSIEDTSTCGGVAGNIQNDVLGFPKLIENSIVATT
jgi:hypothetical protein